MPDVFISYARGDRKRIRPIAKALAAEGFDVWWDQSSSPDGAWTPQLRRALVDSTAILACWSEEAAKSSWVAAEATHANDRKALVNVTLEACKIPAPFSALESANLIKWRGDQDAAAWRSAVGKLRRLLRLRDGDAEEEAEAAPLQQRPAAPAQQAAQVVAPTAFFAQSLGRPQQAATARAAPQPGSGQTPQRAFQPIDGPPPPPKPPPRVVLPPMDPPPPSSPRARGPSAGEPPQAPQARAPEPRQTFRPVDETPDRSRSARPAEAPRASPQQRAQPQVRAFEPIDDRPPQRLQRQARAERQPAPPPRPYTPVDEVPKRRRGPGFASVVLVGTVAALIIGGVIWGGQRFLTAPSAPKLAQDQADAAAPTPLPTETATPQAPAPDIPSAEDLVAEEIQTAGPEPAPADTRTPAKQAPVRPTPAAAVSPPAPRPTAPQQKLASAPAAQPPAPAPASARPPVQPSSAQSGSPPRPPPALALRPTIPESAPTTASARPPATVRPAAQTPPTSATSRQPAITLPATSTAAAAPSADSTRELERCLTRLVRMCPTGSGGRPGFTEDGALSASERALLNQRSLFAWSDALSSNVANCTRHLNAANQASGQSRAYEPLATACRGLPTSGPPR